MVILSRHSLFHYFQYLVMNRDREHEDEFLDALHSGFSGMKIWEIPQETRNVLFEVELQGGIYMVKHLLPIIKGKKEAFNKELKSTELAKAGFALPPLVIDEVSNLLIYRKYLAKSYFIGLRNAKEKIKDETLISFAGHTARFLSAFHRNPVNDIPSLGYQDVLKNWPKVPGELTLELIKFCSLWESSRVIHGDLHKGNMFCDHQAQNIKLIDWETLCKGDPYYDLAIFFREVVFTICGKTFFYGVKGGKTHNDHKLKIFVKRFAQEYDSFCMSKMNTFFKVINAEFCSNDNFHLNIDYFFNNEIS